MSPAPLANVGERLLPSLVDEIAASDPDRIFYSIAKTRDPADGFQDISAKTFARAVDRCAWYLEKNLGRGQGFPTLTYMGPQDVVYGILTLACIKTGYALLLNSPRNTLDAHLSLFEKTDCNTFLLPPNFPLPVVKQILHARPMRVLEIAGMNGWIGDGPEEPYPYTKTFAEARSDPFVVLHTSGSTGMPKPIIQTHATVSPLDAFTALPSLGHKETYPALCAGTRVYLAFPLFHCAGSSMLLPGVIYSGFTAVLGPFPPSADTANAIHVHGNVQHSCLAPMTLVDLAKDPKHLENLSRLQQITYGGGPCPQAVGELISKKTRLVNVLGTTECGVLPIQLCDPEDWAYMSVSPLLGHEYRHFSEDLYEQVIVRDPKLQQYQGIFGTFPELEEWPMKDLYSKHPTKEDVWLYRGRADDIIVFSTGEKLNPIEMENTIGENPAVSAALICGLGRFQSSLLVEAVKPPQSEEEREDLLDRIWPSVQAANKQSPSHGRIHRNMITFTSADKPMLRAGKGTVQRKMTLDLYEAELGALYTDSEEPADRKANGIINGTTGGHGSVQDTVKDIIATSTEIDVNQVAPDVNLFELGLDSLQVTLISRKLNKFLSAKGMRQSLEVRTVYSNPSIAALVTVVSTLVEGKTLTQTTESDEQKMQKLYDMHAANLPLTARKPQGKQSDDLVVLITGSTGSLGSYILDSLVSNSNVRKVYCLNRGTSTLARQQKSQAAKSLQPLPSKVECLDADLSKPYFGLSASTYRKLLGEVTNVIHNAWQVDFNLSIDSFASQVATVRRFIDFSSRSSFGAQIFFISSISAIANWRAADASAEQVLEQIYTDWRMPQPIGYGESKFVAERLLDAAAREADVPAVVCRVGQVAGPTTAAGVWPKQEWLPSLIASSKYLGKIPASLGQMDTVDWIPVDVLCRSIVELAVHSTSARAANASPGAVVYHAANPQHSSWAEVLPTVVRSLKSANGVEVVPLPVWVDALRESEPKTEDVTQNPAIKILGFFDGLVADSASPILLDTKATVAASEMLAGLGPVGDALMENWMRQWAF
ncbi:Uu.00g145550.m01.CDS01 [Anthostomella pinea]|uniref:Uu.00g145550.m01.CDS01 n=1 Tax=Anthostomella pinea TaxID=933095 RepID=A0AAI8YLW8_9PEZI|nr:Uu.00g145550.m01.CDS01 [Anthostomella pinea]